MEVDKVTVEPKTVGILTLCRIAGVTPNHITRSPSSQLATMLVHTNAVSCSQDPQPVLADSHAHRVSSKFCSRIG